ncbi:hypothetical protein HRM2_30220 [Desulforapulum autotrophicum HRM2]|uniref:Uncharacterized protein n=1 Tax=Desulforapulum autotrophicum (strain ATCC 43914 / DSM 3382 / VKM B-1955 / HRM2) TaxID=177437 RepID=C0QK79_DESAH|nr:hypothetical protein HRM2_30220 [Desulforapulum autotrophicum HRM2]
MNQYSQYNIGYTHNSLNYGLRINSFRKGRIHSFPCP